MLKNAPLCTDACNTPAHYTPVSVHPRNMTKHHFTSQQRKGSPKSKSQAAMPWTSEIPVEVWVRKLQPGPRNPANKHVSAEIRESFCESGEGVRLPRKRADLRGSPGNFWGSPGNFRGCLGNFRGSLGNFRGTPGLLLSSTVRELLGSRRKTSGEVWGTSGEVQGLSRGPGEPDSLPATRQLCLQRDP